MKLLTAEKVRKFTRMRKEDDVGISDGKSRSLS